MTKVKTNILIIDDDPLYRRLSRSILNERYNVFAVESPSLGFKILANEPVQFVILDYLLPEMDGLKVLEKIKKDYPNIEVIMISDSGDMDTVIDALRKGAADYFKKPFTASDLWMSIERTQKFALVNRSLNEEKKKNKILKEEMERELGVNIIGESPGIRKIREQMELVAKTPDTSVLIIGESGTGKELIARGIHYLSNRNNEVFSAVNMSAIPESLFESAFFGHIKGSFTGAIADMSGWFENTDKGTLFLDEIGEMSMGLQVKMLRVLEDRQFTKVGAQKLQRFDIRIVAATNKSIEELTNGKDFRLDLFHRLGTFIIHLPPLRERQGDIRPIAEYFLDNISKKLGKAGLKINEEVFTILYHYPFPGNIRELKNILERAIILCSGNELLPLHFQLLQTPSASVNYNTTLSLKEVEKQTILKALEAANNNKAEAARLLDIEWNALYRRLSKYGIETEGD
jgi:DNA-binding NtrC family response regulator